MTWAALQTRLNTAALAVFGESVRIADARHDGRGMAILELETA